MLPVAITTYTFVVAIHVVFVVSFLGAGAAFGVIGPLVGKNPQHAPFALKVNKEIYEKMIIPGMLVVWGTGFYQWNDGGFGGDDLWLIISVALYAVITLVGLFVLYPGIKFVLAELESREQPGPPSAESQARLKKMQVFGPFIGVSMMVITFLMVAQPF